MGQYKLAQLKRYNSEAIAQYYGFRPWLAFWRSVKIIWFFAGFILGLKWDEWQNSVEQNKLKRAAQKKRNEGLTANYTRQTRYFRG